MDKEEKLFFEIAEDLANNNDDVSIGKMMSSPGIKFKTKVFAFYYNKEMVFKLGKEFDPAIFEIEKFSFLSPFKNKPPMKGWFQITWEDNGRWEALAEEALKTMKEGK